VITIIEAMIVITCGAAMLGMCAITLQLLMQMNVDSQARLSGANTWERLCGQLREDVHDCEGFELAVDPKAPTKPASLQLSLTPDHRVTYTVRDLGVLRDESGPGKAIRHELYSLPKARSARFEQRREAAHSLVVLVLTQLGRKGRTDSTSPLEIVALPGKHRLGKRGSGS
jgi:hypothetical protein